MGILDTLKDCGRTVKHFAGWRTSARLVAFAVDDYGSVRTADAAARTFLRKKVPGFGGQMDEFDAMETRQDLEALFEILSRHRDDEDNSCVLTAYCLSANPDFEKIRSDRVYAYERLDRTYARLEEKDANAYSGMQQLWRQGMQAGVIRPQCHGREHYCIPLVDWKLCNHATDLEANLAVESMAGLSSVPELENVGFNEAFGLTDTSRIPEQALVIEDGLRRFEEQFGFASRTFVPPAAKLNRAHDELLYKLGVLGVDVPFLEYQSYGLRSRLPRVNYLGQVRRQVPARVVRTLSFEPCSGVKSDPVGRALHEIGTAFAWRKPAIISSHRVNFGGYLDPANRVRGLQRLDELLAGIRKTWPDVQFVTVDRLVETMRQPAAH